MARSCQIHGHLWLLTSMAKLRVPRLKGERMGVFATRSPHRPCPIGLTVAKVEAVQGNMVLLSGVDLVDGTPILDIKPYLPYCDSIHGAAVPEWVTVDNILAIASVSFSDAFFSTLADCWDTVVDNVLAIASVSFSEAFFSTLADCWDTVVDNILAIASVSFSEAFFSALADCWDTVEKKSLYASPDEFQSLIKEVLSWDIRSVSQRNRPHDCLVKI